MKLLALKRDVTSKPKNSNEYKKILTKVLLVLFRWAMLIAVGYTVLSPLFQIISNSLKNEADFMNTSVVWIPTKLFWQNYKDAIFIMDYFKSLTISAKTGQRVDRLFELIKYVYSQNTMRISTGKLNDILAHELCGKEIRRKKRS